MRGMHTHEVINFKFQEVDIAKGWSLWWLIWCQRDQYWTDMSQSCGNQFGVRDKHSELCCAGNNQTIPLSFPVLQPFWCLFSSGLLDIKFDTRESNLFLCPLLHEEYLNKPEAISLQSCLLLLSLSLSLMLIRCSCACVDYFATVVSLIDASQVKWVQLW